MEEDLSGLRCAPDFPYFSDLRGMRLLIALSGGADSVALAAMLVERREALGLELFAAHLDHGIRPESAEDARWCRALCERLGVPFYTARVDVPAEAARTGEGLETAARRLRYAWLRALRKQLGADRIALAHHMDDQAETVLMHLARGTGPEGICGMAEASEELVRPLLGLRKHRLVAFLAARGLGWREDATNAVADNPRNALRAHVIPELEKSYPQFVPAAARYAQAARIESDYVAEQARLWVQSHVDAGPYGQRLRLDDPPHPALLRRAIRSLCEKDLSWEKLNALEALTQSRRGAVQISGDRYAERCGSSLYFLRRRQSDIRPAPLQVPGKTTLPDICTITAVDAPPVTIRDDPMRQALDAAKLDGCVLRTRRPGDRIRPLGCGDRLLSDYLTDRKVDRPLRDFIPLVAREGRVLWVCGLGISQEAALTPETRRAVRLECDFAFDALY